MAGPDGEFTAEFQALQRLAGTDTAPGGPSNGNYTMGTGLPLVVNTLTDLQSAMAQPIKSPGKAFPDGDTFARFYGTVLEQLISSSQPTSDMQQFVTHVTALRDVAHWTVTNYKDAAALEAAGTNTLKDRIDQALTLPNPASTTQLPGQPPITTTGGK